MNSPQPAPVPSSQDPKGSQQRKPQDQAETQPNQSPAPDGTSPEKTREDVARLENEGGPTPTKDKDVKVD